MILYRQLRDLLLPVVGSQHDLIIPTGKDVYRVKSKPIF
jgi:hypothetical protein